MLTKKKGNYMNSKMKLPKFKNEDEERNFWSKVNLTDYFQADDFVKVSFPNLKPTTKPISIRLPEYIIDQLKEKANETDIPYQALIKSYIKQGLFNNPS